MLLAAQSLKEVTDPIAKGFLSGSSSCRTDALNKLIEALWLIQFYQHFGSNRGEYEVYVGIAA